MRVLTFVPPTDLHVVLAQHSIRSPACGTHDSPSVKQNSSSLVHNIPLPLVDAASEDLVDSDINANVYANIVPRVRIVLVEGEMHQRTLSWLIMWPVGQGHPSSTKFR